MNSASILSSLSDSLADNLEEAVDDGAKDVGLVLLLLLVLNAGADDGLQLVGGHRLRDVPRAVGNAVGGGLVQVATPYDHQRNEEDGQDHYGGDERLLEYGIVAERLHVFLSL